MSTLVRKALLPLLFAGLLPVGAAWSQDTCWRVATGDYFTADNWSEGLPTYNGYIDNGGTAQIQSSGTGPAWQYVRNGRIEMTAGDVRITNVYLTSPTEATLVHSGGKLTIEAELLLGISEGRVGTYEISGSAELILSRGQGYGRELDIGSHGTGLFRQFGGRVTVSDGSIYIGCDVGDPEGRYELYDGELISPEIAIGYFGGPGLLQQTGGTCRVSETVYVRGWYEMSGGVLSASTMDCCLGGRFSQEGGASVIGELLSNAAEAHFSGGTANITRILLSEGGGPPGVLRVSGATSNIVASEYRQGATGLLISEVDGEGLATVQVTGQALLAGEWRVAASPGAPFARFSVLQANGGILGSFDAVALPGPDWTWGIDSGETLWTEHVPEPATLLLLVIGGLALLRRRTGYAA